MPIKLVPLQAISVGSRSRGNGLHNVRCVDEHVFVMRPARDYERATELLAAGARVCDVERRTGIPRSTINNWRRRGRPGSTRRREPWRLTDKPAYAYGLGLYFGDGHITSVKSPFLRLFLDDCYPEIVRAATECLTALFSSPVGAYRYAKRGRVVILQVSSASVVEAFPQHGPGVKHKRRIELEPWQREITHAYPRELIRGLIHSDGCRSVNRFKTKLPSGRIAEYEYVRYFFSNLSEDIKDIFCEHCDRLGIRWSRANPRYVSVHDRASVALLDEFVGPKA